MSTFGHHLRSVVFASDSLTDNQYKKIIKLCGNYTESLGFDRLDLLLVSKFNGMDAVQYEIESNNHGCMPFFLQDNGNPNGLCPLAVISERPIWIVAQDEGKSVYDNSSQLIDLWSGLNNIPEPQGYEESAIVNTEVDIPIRIIRRTIGVASFRSRERITISEHLKTELIHVSDIINQAYLIHKEYLVRSNATSEAIDNISDMSGAARILRGGRANVFVAFPARCREDTISTVRDVIAGNRKLNPTYWDQNFTSGSITEKIVADIMNSDIGIAYFSEFDESDGSYRDNSNVLFEAGLFEGCHRIGRAGRIAWIPIRENTLDRFPFDIAGLNTIIVRRNSKDCINSPLEFDLQSRLHHILVQLGLESG